MRPVCQIPPVVDGPVQVPGDTPGSYTNTIAAGQLATTAGGNPASLAT